MAMYDFATTVQYERDGPEVQEECEKDVEERLHL